MMNQIKFVDLFCGIGGFRVAAEEVFRCNKIIPKCVFSSDIDSYVRDSYFVNFGDYPSGDITKVKASEIPDHDILFGGFPCQPFSIIGKGEGFNDARGTLFFEIVRIIAEKRPTAFILENVKQLAGHKQGQTINRILKILRELGYYADWRILNALDYGLPQKRERVLIVGYIKEIDYKWPDKQKETVPLSKILETNVDEKHYASRYIQEKRKQKHKAVALPSIWHENKSGNVCSYPYSCALRAGASYNYLLVNGERRLTPREMLRLQGFPDSYKVVVPDSQIRKQAGNAVPVNLVKAVLSSLMAFLEADLNLSVKKKEDAVHGREADLPALANSR